MQGREFKGRLLERKSSNASSSRRRNCVEGVSRGEHLCVLPTYTKKTRGEARLERAAESREIALEEP